MPLRPAHRRLSVLPAWAVACGLLLAGCNFHYSRGQALELQNRWEEAAIEYHLAVLKDPNVEEYREAWGRANKVVAQENFAAYQRYLAQKQFLKAYSRLVDASRQDPDSEQVKEEMAKWLRVLVAGKVKFEFSSVKANVSLADEIRLLIRLNTPNTGKVIEAEIDLDSGTFFAEDLLYDSPDQFLTYYTINSLGVALVYGRGATRRFTSREFQRFVSFRTPVLERVTGSLGLNGDSELKPVRAHREAIADQGPSANFWEPGPNPHYALTLEGREIRAQAPGGHTSFTPRFLYVNKQDRRLFVDFGHYEIRLDPKGRKWGVARAPIDGNDYFARFSQNIALQPYFFYREGVFAYVSAGSS